MAESLASNDPEEEEAALRDTAAAVLRLGNSTETPPDSQLHNAAQIAAALANRDMQAIADRIPEVIPNLSESKVVPTTVFSVVTSGDVGLETASADWLVPQLSRKANSL